MKKVLFATALIVSVMMVLACKSTPLTQEEAETAFQKIYNEYKDNLVLEGAATYKVVSGDSLTKIARAQYGADSGFYFPLIMLASSDIVLDPDKIQPDMNLTVPVLQKNLDDANAKGHLKNFLLEIATVYDRREGREADAAGLRALADTL